MNRVADGKMNRKTDGQTDGQMYKVCMFRDRQTD